MKKLKIVFFMLVTFAAASMANAASTGVITFNGELSACTCDVQVDGQTNDASVTLPTVGTNQLTTAGETAGRTNFNMSLTNCVGTLQTASAFFIGGASVDPVTGRLRNVNGTATQVGYQLRDDSSPTQDVIQIGNGSQFANSTYVDVSSGSAILPYAVEYYADGTTTAGTVVSNVTYLLQYK